MHIMTLDQIDQILKGASMELLYGQNIDLKMGKLIILIFLSQVLALSSSGGQQEQSKDHLLCAVERSIASTAEQRAKIFIIALERLNFFSFFPLLANQENRIINLKKPIKTEMPTKMIPEGRDNFASYCYIPVVPHLLTTSRNILCSIVLQQEFFVKRITTDYSSA